MPGDAVLRELLDERGRPHYCLGAALGRAEGQIAFPRLLARFPDLALAEPPTERRALMLRGYDRLPVRLKQLVGASR